MFSKSLLLSLATLATVAFGAPTKRSTFNKMLLVLFENTDYSTTITDPNFSSFASEGILYTNWVAITHPSQPNYIALTSGSTNGVTSDTTTTLNVENIADLLEAKGLTWKSYQENWPGPCYTGTSDGLYYRKHNPFISYQDIQTNSTRCANIVDSTQLATDIANDALPNFAFFTPNINDDAHNTDVTYAGSWLSTFLADNPVTSAFDLVMLTFDENSGTAGNLIYTAVVGPAVTSQGTTDNTALNHYSILATLEQNFGLGNLGQNDVGATPFTY